jgi:hypothetical protein
MSLDAPEAPGDNGCVCEEVFSASATVSTATNLSEKDDTHSCGWSDLGLSDADSSEEVCDSAPSLLTAASQDHDDRLPTVAQDKTSDTYGCSCVENDAQTGSAHYLSFPPLRLHRVTSMDACLEDAPCSVMEAKHDELGDCPGECESNKRVQLRHSLGKECMEEAAESKMQAKLRARRESIASQKISGRGQLF